MAKNDEAFSFKDFALGLAEKVQTQATRPNIYGYIAHDKQVLFHSAERRHRLYIGGNRSGKTTGGIVEDIWWLTGKHPYRKVPQGGVRGRIVGVDFLNGIEKILLPEFKRWCPVAELRGGSWDKAYDKQERVLHFNNGSFVEFMSYDQEIDKFAGTSRHFVHFDEEPPLEIYLECIARLVDTGGSWWMTLTPIMGMEWMYDDIYLRGLNEADSNITVIEVEMWENPHLDPQEIQAFLDSLPEEDRDARVKGKFVRRGGIIYKHFDLRVHVIPPLETIPLHDELYSSMDHGYNNPTSWHWHLVNGDGDVITFMEHYESEMIVEDHAAQIKIMEAVIGREPGIRVGDPAIGQRTGVTGTSIQTEYAQYGIYITLGNNDVISGINKVNSYLKYDLRTTPPRRPRWYITSNCTNLIREIQKYRWKTWSNKKSERQNNAYDVPHKKDDHAMDDIRYFFTLMPDLKPLTAPVAEKLSSHPEYPLPYQPVFDKNVSKQPVPSGDWNIQAADEFMGQEW